MLTATTLADFARCDHRVFLDAHGDASERATPSEHQQLLWSEGREHESEIVTSLPHVAVSPALGLEARATMTRMFMEMGEVRIYHGVLLGDGLIGEPDFLERVDAASSLGDYSYVPVEVKHGKAFTQRDGDTPKLPYALQLCAYADLLESAQGLRPMSGYVIDDRGERQEIPIDDALWQSYLTAKATAAGITAGAIATEPGYRPSCATCSWQKKCWGDLVARGDLTTLPGIGIDKRTVLYTIGIRTIAELADAAPESLAVKGISPKNRAAWPMRAQAMRDGVPKLVRTWTPPRADFEISYDVETCDGEVYLHGLLVRRGGARRWTRGSADDCFGTFEPVCADRAESEEHVWRRFCEKVAEIVSRGTVAVYIYTPAERSALRTLKAKYGSTPMLGLFESAIVDLKKELCASVIFPESDQGLKTLASYVGFRWRDQDPGGAQSIAWWKAYRADPVANADQRSRVLAYNEDDTRATFALLDWYRGFTAGRDVTS